MTYFLLFSKNGGKIPAQIFGVEIQKLAEKPVKKYSQNY